MLQWKYVCLKYDQFTNLDVLGYNCILKKEYRSMDSAYSSCKWKLFNSNDCLFQKMYYYMIIFSDNVDILIFHFQKSKAYTFWYDLKSLE